MSESVSLNILVERDRDDEGIWFNNATCIPRVGDWVSVVRPGGQGRIAAGTVSSVAWTFTEGFQRPTVDVYLKDSPND